MGEGISFDPKKSLSNADIKAEDYAKTFDDGLIKLGVEHGLVVGAEEATSVPPVDKDAYQAKLEAQTAAHGRVVGAEGGATSVPPVDKDAYEAMLRKMENDHKNVSK